MHAFFTFRSNLYPLGTLLLVVLATGLIFFSSRKQSLTVDEPNHLYCGMEWLQGGTYTAWPENPPLSRVIIALIPYMQEHTIQMPHQENVPLFNQFLAANDRQYFATGPIQERLLWIRILILPLFLLSVWVVWYWSRSLTGDKAAFLAVGMYTSLPPILAHSGLATTDIAFVSFFTLLIFCFSRWLNKPSYKRGIWLGLSLGATLLTKYSVLAFFPPIALFMLLVFYLSARKEKGFSQRSWLFSAFKTGVLAAAITFITIWTFFGFSTGSLGDQAVIKAAIQEGAIPASVGKIWVPAPEWFSGLRLLMLHNERGHVAYIAGQMTNQGFWYFYPLATLIKTPWPFLLLMFVGVIGAILPKDPKQKWEVTALSMLPFVILLGGLSSNINIGLRHVLIIYPLGAVGASIGFMRLMNTYLNKPKWAALASLSLVLCQLIIAALAFPIYLSYFNPIAGEEPGELLMDSDLDWGQGMIELAEFCREHKIEQMSLSYFGSGQDCWYGLPQIKPLPPDTLVEGWVAISEMVYRGVWLGMVSPIDSCHNLYFRPMFNEKLEASNGYRWLDQFPLEAKIGGSIRLYHIQKADGRTLPQNLPATLR